MEEGMGRSGVVKRVCGSGDELVSRRLCAQSGLASDRERYLSRHCNPKWQYKLAISDKKHLTALVNVKADDASIKCLEKLEQARWYMSSN